jgi:nicotinate-nucleotide adenylyltransferase
VATCYKYCLAIVEWGRTTLTYHDSNKPMGVFGGTYDPIHYGHLRTAFEMLQSLRFGEVAFIPCGDPPHRAKPAASAELRLAMVRVATENQIGFTVDDREIWREGPSYSVDTLAALRNECPSRSIALIIGMDAFLGLNKWHKWREILQLAHIVVAHRPGWRAPDMGPLGDMLAASGTHKIEDLHNAVSGHIYVHDVTQLEISSTEIRDLVAAGRDPRFLMPDAVRDIIEESGCYRASATLQDKT